MVPRKIAHIGIAVKNLDESVRFYSEVLGLEMEDSEQAGELKAAFLKIGETHIELLQSTTEEGVIAKFISKKGEGVHHIAFEVEDIGQAISDLKGMDVALIDNKPRDGAHGSQGAFLHPKSSYGVLIELVQPGRSK
jgi:methylmalonyl-CoA/ethylmalonyl-CoA epimerase